MTALSLHITTSCCAVCTSLLFIGRFRTTTLSREVREVFGSGAATAPEVLLRVTLTARLPGAAEGILLDPQLAPPTDGRLGCAGLWKP
mmetsp:Transcript_28789/g.67757  ORF Transcript_28789/g.67757 Transcript_28789/m.67757 type:complete len:88 (-) Transcript_28789:209-472(-)